MEDKNRQCKGTQLFSIRRQRASLCRCLAITPNLVVHSGSPVEACHSYESTPALNSPHRLLSCVYKFLLFWLHNPHFYDGP